MGGAGADVDADADVFMAPLSPPWHEPCWSWSTALVPACHPSPPPQPAS
jgi:hypothetical protein